MEKSQAPYVAWSSPSAEKPRIPIVGEDDQDSEGGCFNGCCAYVLVIVSVVLIIMTFPLSLFFMIKVRSAGRGGVRVGGIYMQNKMKHAHLS